jgi:glycosyltransferase involved in cell wall biosynthesis
MRIAFVTFNDPSYRGGGSGRNAIRICEELAKMGHQVVIIAPGLRKSVEELGENLIVKRVKTNSGLPLKSLQFWIGVPKAIRECERDSAFDVIHFNGVSYWFLRRRLSRAVQVCTVHHLVKDARGDDSKKPFTLLSAFSTENNPLLPFLEKRCIDSVDRIITVSEFTRRRIMEEYRIPMELIDIVPNGVEKNTQVSGLPVASEARNLLGFGSKPVLLFVGRVDDPRKGIGTMLSVLGLLSKEMNVHLVVVGGGSQEDARRKADALGVFERVTFTGLISEDLLKTYYVASDVFVCTSTMEGFGLTVLEAMENGLPIVATAVGAIPELVENGVNGYLVSNNRPEDIAEKVRLLLSDENTRIRIGVSNRRKAENLTSWAQSAKLVSRSYGIAFERRMH